MRRRRLRATRSVADAPENATKITAHQTHAQRDEMKEQSRLKKAGIVPIREESEPNDDLFGEQDEEEGNEMDLS